MRFVMKSLGKLLYIYGSPYCITLLRQVRSWDNLSFNILIDGILMFRVINKHGWAEI